MRPETRRWGVARDQEVGSHVARDQEVGSHEARDQEVG